jgi:hypothetical protein
MYVIAGSIEFLAVDGMMDGSSAWRLYNRCQDTRR